MIVQFSPVNIGERKKLDLRAGDRVRVWQRIKEKGKVRLQPFEGLVIARKHGREPGATFTVRKIASGVGMEKTFPLYSPVLDKIEVLTRSKARRAKLYYVRNKTAKQIRRKMKALAEFVPVVHEEKKEKIEEEAEKSAEKNEEPQKGEQKDKQDKDENKEKQKPQESKDKAKKKEESKKKNEEQGETEIETEKEK